jgi:hypothetical protein
MAQPADVSRVLRSIDFEERRLGNNEDLPMRWLKVEGDGLPAYVNGKLANDRAHGGTWSFKLTLNGGSLIYRYDPDQLPVQFGAHYKMSAWVSTTPMAHARARITAYFTDRDGHPLPSTITHSELYAASDDQIKWEQLHVELTANDPKAALLAIEVELVQPRFFQTNAIGSRTILPQDIDGSAWFDDVLVSQVPEVKLETDKPGNVFRFSDSMRMSVTVNDRFTQDLAAQLVIKDGTGTTVYEHSGALAASATTSLGPGVKRTTVPLPDLPAGWYEANLVMTSQGQLVGQQHLDFLRLADNALTTVPDGRFGIIATRMPIGSWDQLPSILPVLSAGRVKLSVWNNQWDVQESSEQSTKFDNMLQELESVGITPTACLVDLPPSVIQRYGDGLTGDAVNALTASASIATSDSGVGSGRSWLRLLTSDPGLWQPPLAYLISRHATHLDRWQLGDDETDAFVADPRMRQAYDKVYEQFAKLTDKPDLAMPWPAWYDMTGSLPSTVALWVPPSILPSELPLYIQDINSRQSDGKRHNLSLSLALLDRAQYGRDTQVRDLVQRVTYALAAGADRIDIPMPMNVRREGESWIVEPQETFIIVRTLIRTLGGAVFKGKIPVGDGVDAFLFDRGGHGLLVMWSKGDRSGLVPLDLNLGTRPMRLDMWGNVTPLQKPTTRAAAPGGVESSQVNIELGNMPIILTDIDAPIAQIRASVGLDQPLVESSFQVHQRKIHFVNSYPDAINGTLRLRPPPGWVVNPPTFNYSLQPGETFDRPITVEFPYNSIAGPKQIMGDFQIQDVPNGLFTVPIALNLGLSDVGMQTLALRDHNDVVVQQLITNYSEQPVDYIAFAVYPGQARQERLVTRLGAGKTIMKVYRFQDVTVPPDAKVRAGLKEMVGSRILNDTVPVQ